MKKYFVIIIVVLLSVGAVSGLVYLFVSYSFFTIDQNIGKSVFSDDSDAARPAVSGNGGALRIAVITSVTGGIPVPGQTVRRAVETAAEYRNGRGGILGNPVELLLLDSGGTPLGAYRAAEEAVRHKVTAVIGEVFSSHTLAMVPVLEEAGIVVVTPAATHPEVTMSGDYTFRVCYTDVMQGAAAASFAYDTLSARRAVVCTDLGNDYSIELSRFIQSNFSKSGGTIVKDIEYLSGVTESAQIVEEILSVSPDVIFLTGYPDSSLGIIEGVRKNKSAVPFVAGDGIHDPRLLELEDIVTDVYATDSWDASMAREGKAAGIFDLYEEKYGETSMSLVPLAIDAFSFITQAVEDAGELTTEKIYNSFSALRRFDSIAGATEIDHNGDALRSVVIRKYHGGRIEYASEVEQDVINIGVIFAKTGQASIDNLYHYKGVRFAADRYNENGGVRGRRVRLIEYDNESSTLVSRKRAEEAVRDGVSAVIGSSWSSHSMAIAPVLQEAGIPMLTPMSTNPDVTKIGDYIFRACFIDSFQGRIMAEFAVDNLRARTAAVLTNSHNKFSVDLSAIFIKSFIGLGGRIVYREEYLNDDADFNDIARAVQSLSPDVIYLPGYLRDSCLIMRQVTDIAGPQVFLGPDSWNDTFYQYGGDAIIGSYFTNFWHRDISTAKNLDFVEQFENRYGPIRDGNIAQAYDAGGMLLDAMSHSDTLDPQSIRDALADTRGYEGVTGVITLNDNGDPVNKSAVILRFRDDESTFVTTVRPVE